MVRMRSIASFIYIFVRSTDDVQVFDSDDGVGNEEGESGDLDYDNEGHEGVARDKFGNVLDKAAAERAVLEEARAAARAARAAKASVWVEFP